VKASRCSIVGPPGRGARTCTRGADRLVAARLLAFSQTKPAAVWEIHPVYAIDVCTKKTFSACRLNVAADWRPIFHALTHFKGVNPEVAQLLIDRGADLTIRARVPGHYERPGELLDVSAAEYAAIFPLS
jgi:hypothetical protein